MATRYIQTDFWSDSKIHDKISVDERYLMLYFMTNPHTNQTGCYEISISTIGFEIGFDEKRFKIAQEKLSKLRLCEYDYNTQEVLILNWYKYNWTKSLKVEKCIKKEIEKIKSKKFIDYINRVCIPYAHPMDTLLGKKRKEKERKENKKEINKEEIFDFIEREFGRTINSTEYEFVNSWNEYINNFGSSINEVIILAIKEAVLNQARSFKYIDKILYNWAQQGLKSENDVKKYLERNKNNKNNSELNDGYEVFL